MVNAITEIKNVNNEHNKKNIKFSLNDPKKEDATKQSPDSTKNDTNKISENSKQKENTTNVNCEKGKETKMNGFKENEPNKGSDMETLNDKDVTDDVQVKPEILAKIGDIKEENKVNFKTNKESPKIAPKSIELKIITTTFLPNSMEETLS